MEAVWVPIAAIVGTFLASVFGAILVFRGGREDRSKAVTDASIALLNEVQEERTAWKERVHLLEEDVRQLRSELAETHKERRRCEYELAEVRAMVSRIDMKRDKE